MPDELLITGATLVTMDAEERILPSAWLHIGDGQIVGLGDGPPPAAPGASRLDASGLVAIPGLVNAHTHLFQTFIRGLFDGLPFNTWLGAIYHCGRVFETEDWRRSASLGALESVRSGVTTIVDHQFLDRGTEWSSAIIDGIRQVGPRAILARTSMDLADLAPAEMLESVEQGRAAVETLRQRHAPEIADGHVRILAGPNTPGVSAGDELAVAYARAAREEGLAIAMHVAESREVLEATEARYGVRGVVRWLTSIDALPAGTLAAHCVHLDDEEIEMLADREVVVAHNPVSNLYLGDGIARISRMLAAGVRVVLGTDGAASNNSQDLFEVMKLAALLTRIREPTARRVTPADILRMATIDGARSVGLGDLSGSLEQGKRADVALVALGSSPHSVPSHDPISSLVFNARAADVVHVIVDGRIVLQGGRIRTIDEGSVLAESRERAAALAGRLRELA